MGILLYSLLSFPSLIQSSFWGPNSILVTYPEVQWDSSCLWFVFTRSLLLLKDAADLSEWGKNYELITQNNNLDLKISF